jgi:IclR family transcriptional regulator, KDG regulon repressor
MYSAPLLKKAFEVVRLIALSEGPLGVTDISKALSISKSTTFGILKALETGEFLFKDSGTKKYSIGQALLALAQQVFKGADLTAVAKPHLERLVSIVDETVFLGIREENNVKVLDVYEARKPYKISSPIGSKLPITASVLGKVFLSTALNDEIEHYLRDIGLPRYTENSITDIDKFLEEIELTRQLGYGVDREEYLKGLRAIASLIYAGAVPIGAVWIVGFAQSMKDEKLPRMIEHLKEATAVISERVTHLRSAGHSSANS